jgi:hypothetical protein
VEHPATSVGHSEASVEHTSGSEGQDKGENAHV